MAEVSIKRDRGKNFTDVEKDQLIEISFKYKSLVENKKTDKISTKDKNQAWEHIKEEYNAVQTSGVREVRTLKALYDGLKMKARKENTEEKVDLYKTGGGSSASIMTPLSMKIVGHLQSQFEPLPNQYDSSSILFDEVAECDSGANPVTPIEEEIVLTTPLLLEQYFEEEKDETPPAIIAPPKKKRKVDEISTLIENYTEKRVSSSTAKTDFYAKEHEKK